MPLVPESHRPVAVNQPPFGGSDYPFVDPSDDVKGLFADFYLASPDPTCGFQAPYRISWLRGFGFVVSAPSAPDPAPADVYPHAYDLLVVDAANQTVFDSTLAEDFDVHDVWDRLRVLSWDTADAVCRATVYFTDGVECLTEAEAAALTEEEAAELVEACGEGESGPGGHAYEFLPEQAVLSARTCETPTPQVSTVGPLLSDASGHLELIAGTNMVLEPVDLPAVDGERLRTRILFHARRGAGLGLSDACASQDPNLLRINNVAGDSAGRFKLEAGGCHSVRRAVSVVSESPRETEFAWSGYPDNDEGAAMAAATLLLANDCKPCCECPDFVNTYEGIRVLRHAYVELGQRAEAARDLYAANKTRWEAQLQCRLARPARLVVAAESRCKAFIGAAFCNLRQCCVAPVTLRLTFLSTQDGSPESSPMLALCDSVRKKGGEVKTETEFVFGGDYPVLDASFDYLDPQETAMLKARFRMPGCEQGRSLQVYLSVHAPDVDGCELPDAPDVPAEVAALWASAPALPTVRHIVTQSVELNPLSRCAC